ncbi:formylglycine-generating enzyme family protein [Dokdonella koreensis]|uniref:Sulfatase-modifying factor protein n=1 Tax=Dokdonella koreensis DS-123 TaxID=1300342 RepID=A0A160DVS5_9GAMM|nr:formylglycine-generating enzyme family protein [Dokdonella koreensis]ANB18251.1 Sulfatase-modifying factor protein [Dokdonella koreensis DS-123]
MPGTESVSKQAVLGGVAGIALLAFALTYRFFPGVFHPAPQVQQQPTASQPASPAIAPWIAEQRPPTEAEPAAPSADGAAQTLLAEAVAMGPPAPVTEAVAALLKRARSAEAQGRLIEPADGSAVALYREVLAQDAGNAEAELALKRIGGAIRDWAIAAMERGENAEARRFVAAFADLPHADSELSQLEARLRVLNQVMPLLARAADLLKAGKAVGEGEDTALAVYRQALALDPDNALVDQGLAQIERGFLDQALAAAAQDDFAGADRILADAVAVRPGSQEQQDTRARIEGLRHQQAESVLAQAGSALDAGNADLAEDLLERALAISPDLPGVDDFNQRLRNARLYASFRPGEVIRDTFLATAGQGPPLVVIPTGSFVMGSAADEEGHRDNEEPQRRVEVGAGVAFGQSEVTVGQFRDFVNAAGYVTDAERAGTGSYYDEGTGRLADRRGMTWKNDYSGGRADDNLPVINVSWNDATTYLAWLSQQTGKRYRLPSEAEFEYALRAGSTTPYPWGEGDPRRPVGNFTGDGDRSPKKRSWARAFAEYSDGYWGPAPVRSYPANAFGLHDMVGNVSEWVEDCWHDNYTRAPRDQQAWVNPGCSNRVIRGGSWGSAPDQVRSAWRAGLAAGSRSAQIGFRPVRDL